MELSIFTVDAFTSGPFRGNPASVCVLEKHQTLDAKSMQSIACEMNLSETAFVQESKSDTTSQGSKFGLRWFTPTTEVDLCGHATLASAAVLFNRYGNRNNKIEFETLSGTLTAENKSGMITLSLPLADITDTIPKEASSVIEKIIPKIDRTELQIIFSAVTKKLLVRLPNSYTRDYLEAIAVPNPADLLTAHNGSEIQGVILTMEKGGTDFNDVPYDFISRYFAPWKGISEDPVTGAAHTVLGRYWAQQLNKTNLYARQCSSRGGDLTLLVDEDNGRLFVSGEAYIVLSGKLHLP